MKIMLDKGAVLPTKAHDADAGYDLYSPEDRIIPAYGSVTIDTGVHVQIPPGWAGLLVSKSGLNVNHDLTSTGLIDCEYTGSIKVKLHNHGAAYYHVSKGDKITQLVFIPIGSFSLQIADDLAETERGDNGFGSSGR